MIKPENDIWMRALIMDSLVARSGKQLSSEVIQEITAEILERMLEAVAKVVEDLDKNGLEYW